MTMTDAELELVDACIRLADARETLRSAQHAKASALRAMHWQDGLAKARVAARAREVLAEEFTAEGIAASGLSDGNVRVILDRGRA